MTVSMEEGKMADSEKAWHSSGKPSDGGVVSVHTACLVGSGFNPVNCEPQPLDC